MGNIRSCKEVKLQKRMKSVIQIVFVLAVFAIIENKWNINYIQTLPAQIQQKLLRKLLEKVFITNISTQCKHHTP